MGNDRGMHAVVIESRTLKLPMATYGRRMLRATRKQGCRSPFIEARAVNDEKTRRGTEGQRANWRSGGPWAANSYIQTDQSDRWTKDGWFRNRDVVTIDVELLKDHRSGEGLDQSGIEWISWVDLENAIVAHEAVKVGRG